MFVDGALRWLDSGVVVVVVMEDKFGSDDVTAAVSYKRIESSTYFTCERNGISFTAIRSLIGFFFRNNKCLSIKKQNAHTNSA